MNVTEMSGDGTGAQAPCATAGGASGQAVRIQAARATAAVRRKRMAGTGTISRVGSRAGGGRGSAADRTRLPCQISPAIGSRVMIDRRAVLKYAGLAPALGALGRLASAAEPSPAP